MTRRIVTLLIIAPYKYSFTYLLTLVGRVYMVPVFHRNYVCRLYLVPFLILSVKEWRDLEIWVRSHSRSFKMVPFEYWVYGFLFTFFVFYSNGCVMSSFPR